ncbi:MAG: hypothetical protein K0R02_499 [Rickettsiaceae bacterium]|jgi:hypothetical protein|nr:hypothetical protein [Rickettsiaceae bacterium]
MSKLLTFILLSLLSFNAGASTKTLLYEVAYKENADDSSEDSTLDTSSNNDSNIDDTITQAVKSVQPSTTESNPQEDLKKIEEEFDLGETTNENTPDTSKIDIAPQSIPNKPPAQDSAGNEEDVDLESVISANYYNKATVLITNKITAKSQLLTINVGSSAFFGNIEIFPLKCWKSPSRYNPESKAFVNVIERKIDEDSKNIFKGWLFSSSISLSTMEHPIYEISITDCTGDKLNLNR